MGFQRHRAASLHQISTTWNSSKQAIHPAKLTSAFIKMSQAYKSELELKEISVELLYKYITAGETNDSHNLNYGMLPFPDSWFKLHMLQS